MLIKLGVKIILLAKNKDLTIEDLLKHKNGIKNVCDTMSHHVLFTFEYTPGGGIVTVIINQLTLEVSKTLHNYLSPKNMVRFNELHTYLNSGPILDTLFTDPSVRKLKNEWNYLMKNISTRMDLIE